MTANDMPESQEADLVFVAKEDSKPLIPPGGYQVIYFRHEIRKWYGSQKLYVTYEVCTFGTHQGTRIFRSYNYDKNPGRGTDLYKDLELLYGARVRKNTRLSLSLFKGKVLDVVVRTVTHGRKQQPLAPHQQYSVVDRIVGVAAGGTGVPR